MRKLILTLGILLAAVTARADDAPFDAKKLVFDHMGDSYGWHLVTWGEHHVTLPLPVIVRGTNGQWHVFSSSHLAHGIGTYEGFTIAREGKYEGKIIDEKTGGRPLDLSLTKNAAAILLNCCVLLALILPLARWYRRGQKASGVAQQMPGGVRGAVESLVAYIYDDVIVPGVGEHHRKYAPYLLTMFFFILVTNMMGLIPIFPGGANVTGNIAVTGILALCTMLVVNFSGTKEYWKEIFWPDVPAWLKVPAPIMPVIELVGVITKPFALMIRLFANMFAGHTVILALVCVIFITVRLGAAINGTMTVVAVLFTIFMFCIELLVAFIQAYIFTLLSSVFIGMATVKHEHK